MTLRKRDLQLYFKRLRKLHEQRYGYYQSRLNPIKYYAVGEYGGETFRPHYHACIFNAHKDDLVKAWEYRSRPIGLVHIGDKVEARTIVYMYKYLQKQSRVPLHKNDDRLKEYSVCSKGLGAQYINPRSIAWHNATDDRLYVVLPGGAKATLPRYYRAKIFEEDKLDRVLQNAKQIHLDKIARLQAEHGDRYEQYLIDVREQIIKKANRNVKLNQKI